MAALLAPLIRVLTEWPGRNILFPFQIPVGLLETLISDAYFMWLMLRGEVAL